MTRDEFIESMPSNQSVHTFKQGGPMLIGADWDRIEVINRLDSCASFGEAGESARSMGHGLFIELNEGDFLFVENREDLYE